MRSCRPAACTCYLSLTDFLSVRLIYLVYFPVCEPAVPLQTVFLRNYTTEAAKMIPDNSLDFVYVDAR